MIEEVLLGASAEGGEVYQETLVALTVSGNGRVHYHYAIGGAGGFTADILEMVGRPWLATFDQIIEVNELDITTIETADGDIYDVALNDATTLPHGATLYGTGRCASGQ